MAVPTFNRAALLKETLASILAQKDPAFRVVVFDNASTDETAAVIRGFGDPRVSHNRSPVNLGLRGNWARCIRTNPSPFLCICHDDDLLLDGFLAASLAMLKTHPEAGFSYARARIIDARGRPRVCSAKQHLAPAGVVDGFRFLEEMVASDRPPTIFPSSVVFRASALTEVGVFDSAHTKAAMDINMFFRMARRFPVACLGRELIAQRLHPGQLSEEFFRGGEPSGMQAIYAEQLDAAAYLLESPRAADPAFRRWLTGRILALHRRESDSMHGLAPKVYWDWAEQFAFAQEELERVIPTDTPFILVDEDTWGLGNDFRGRFVWPFPERNGLFWGTPTDGASAVAELQRLRDSGAKFIAFTWTTRWWLDHFEELDQALCQHADCVLRSPRLIVFKLASDTATSNGQGRPRRATRQRRPANPKPAGRRRN